MRRNVILGVLFSLIPIGVFGQDGFGEVSFGYAYARRNQTNFYGWQSGMGCHPVRSRVSNGRRRL